MRKLTTIAVLALPAVLAACASTYEVDASPPTVTYGYDGRGAYNEVARRADRHCRENYGLRAYAIDRRETRQGYEATFSCE